MRNRIVLAAATGLLATGGLGFSATVASAVGTVGNPSPKSSCVAYFNTVVGPPTTPSVPATGGVSSFAQEPHGVCPVPPS